MALVQSASHLDVFDPFKKARAFTWSWVEPQLLASQAHSLEGNFWTSLLVSEGRTMVPCGRQRQTLPMAQT